MQDIFNGDSGFIKLGAEVLNMAQLHTMYILG